MIFQVVVSSNRPAPCGLVCSQDLLSLSIWSNPYVAAAAGVVMQLFCKQIFWVMHVPDSALKKLHTCSGDKANDPETK